MLSDEAKIHGRCGYIRQGFPFIFKDYKWNKLSFHIDGVNSKLSDLDYLSNVQEITDANSIGYDLISPSYFRKNKFISWLTNKVAPKSTKGSAKSMRDIYLDGLSEILKLFETSVSRVDNIIYIMESLKNSLIGKVHMPHSYFIENGIHAMTFEGVHSE